MAGTNTTKDQGTSATHSSRGSVHFSSPPALGPPDRQNPRRRYRRPPPEPV